MRVLFLSDHLGYPDGVSTGATTYFLQVLPRLQAHDIDVTVCFLRDRHPAADSLIAQGVVPLFLNRAKWDPLALSDLLSLARQRSIDIIHAAGMKGILLGRLAAKLHGSKTIMHLHDTGLPGPVLGCLHRCMAGWTDRCLAISKAVQRHAIDHFGLSIDQTTVLYNGIDLHKAAQPRPDARQRIRSECNIPQTGAVITIIGRLSPEKGQTFFLPSLPQLLSSHPHIHLLIVGEGPTRQECERIILSTHTQEAIRLLGHRNDIPDILAASDIVLIPSLMEGLSFVAIEAMAAGKPVVAFRVGGLPELIHHGQTGVLAPEKDIPALLGEIRNLLDQPHKTQILVSNAIEFVQQFSLEVHIEKLLAIYKQTLEN